MDTPGLTDTHHPDEVITREIVKSLGALSPGPHAVLMVVKGKERFTQEEFDAYIKVKKLVGEELATHMIVVFTGGDELDRQGIELGDQIAKGSENLQTMLKEVSNRYVVIDNFADEEKNRKQMSGLLDVVRKVAPKQSGHFSNPLQKDLDASVQEAVVAQERAASPTMSESQARGKVNQALMSLGDDTHAAQPTPAFVHHMEKKVEKHSKKKNILCVLL